MSDRSDRIHRTVEKTEWIFRLMGLFSTILVPVTLWFLSQTATVVGKTIEKVHLIELDVATLRTVALTQKDGRDIANQFFELKNRLSLLEERDGMLKMKDAAPQ